MQVGHHVSPPTAAAAAACRGFESAGEVTPDRHKRQGSGASWGRGGHPSSRSSPAPLPGSGQARRAAPSAPQTPMSAGLAQGTSASASMSGGLGLGSAMSWAMAASLAPARPPSAPPTPSGTTTTTSGLGPAGSGLAPQVGARRTATVPAGLAAAQPAQRSASHQPTYRAQAAAQQQRGPQQYQQQQQYGARGAGVSSSGGAGGEPLSARERIEADRAQMIAVVGGCCGRAGGLRAPACLQ